MARGRLLKTVVKEAKKVAEAETTARLKAAYKVKSKNVLEEIKNRLLNVLENIDLLEFASVLATTYIIHGIILTTTELFERAQNLSQGLRLISGTPEWIKFLPFADTPLGWTANIPFLIGQLWDILNQNENIPEETKERIAKGAQQILENPDSDSLYIWALSYAIAYYVQKHGISDMLGTIKSFVGIAAAA